ncbi:G-type lectin S-receptor-like serine/threonine-protein kinase At4g03230 [Rutidosis leptorrhynchoides]|uniref:G-type lectin S-receptor-like serine/threonine-protein kinase At4g03230 n=1 Tax=Rutidosis leptorrhynchoides TaxID=125765 RepID=UPI003A99D314
MNNLNLPDLEIQQRRVKEEVTGPPTRCSITTGETIEGTGYLESAGGQFQMGFFSRGLEQRRYIGIWYTKDIPRTTVVWVGNRDYPLQGSDGVLTISQNGDVKLLDKDQNDFYFNISTDGDPEKTMKLLDSGNAVLIDASGSYVWESFKHPTDTFLPGMKMETNLILTSWKSVDDPSSGSYVFQQDETNQYFIQDTTDTSNYRWKNGRGSLNNFIPDQLFIGAYYMLSNSTKPPKDTNLCDSLDYNNSRLLMSQAGNLQYFSWSEQEKRWDLNWQAPQDYCSIYRVCGKFGFCSLSDNPQCSCLPGFDPITREVFYDGCEPKYKCNHDRDEFLNLAVIKVENPGRPVDKSKNENECRTTCLQECSCKAYSYTPANGKQSNTGRPYGCWIWDSDVFDLQEGGTHNISIRVSRAVQEYSNQPEAYGPSPSFITRTNILIFTMTILLIMLLASLSYIYYKRMVLTREQRMNSTLQRDHDERWAIDLLDLDHSRTEDTQGIGIPFYNFESIQVATNHFSDANKLGEGGFGPVYKGEFPGGLEVAIKRLSSISNQGLEEFRNEITLIAKLQHRNLVRLLGYCIKGNEKILLYEYMPNKSLDAFIFDEAPAIILNWANRYDIIMGIARGLLYLHQDSRLRIIHRDLKTSNILLDEELNPKISDFGLAKIVQGREMEASTNRVIGTYGYMAPEYALDGFFSIKSDTFSFGVVVLEIISGKKNTGPSQFQQNLSLLGYAWNLWKEDTPLKLMDQRLLLESSNSSEVLKCIVVALLCVQEDPGDRPTMTNVVLMLAGDIASLPTPKQPAFVVRKTMSSSSSSSYKPDQSQTNNNLTVTLEGR